MIKFHVFVLKKVIHVQEVLVFTEQGFAIIWKTNIEHVSNAQTNHLILSVGKPPKSLAGI